MKNDFMARAAQIIAEVRNKTSIEEIDLEVLEVILQDELSEYHNEVFTYCNTTGYDAGYDTGYEDGYMSISDEAADRAYSEGYSEGYYEGYDDGYERRVCGLSRVFHGFQDDSADAESDNEAYLAAIESAYEEGYSLGYSDGSSGV